MSYSYTTLLEADYKRQIKFNHVEDYHSAGYKGKGLTILNAEGTSDHREMTSGVISAWIPEVTLLESGISSKVSNGVVEFCNVTLNGETLNLEDAINKYKIKVITRSYSGTISKGLSDYFKDLQKRKGVIFVCSAGNESDHAGCYSQYNTAIAVSASTLKADGTITITYYGELGEIDFTCFMARGRGTSAASPALASLIILLLQKYGDFNQEECIEILKLISIDLGQVDYDAYFGWGLPILPLTDELKIIIGGNVMTFKDVEETRWSKPAIDYCVEQGILVGFEDGTFRPTETVTREQLAVIIQRILNT